MRVGRIPVFHSTGSPPHLQIASPSLCLCPQAIRLSDSVALVTLPGEVFVDLGLDIKRESPFEHTIVIQLANDAPGYIPTQKAFVEGSYETVNSQIQSGGGEQMRDAAITLLKELKRRE